MTAFPTGKNESRHISRSRTMSGDTIVLLLSMIVISLAAIRGALTAAESETPPNRPAAFSFTQPQTYRLKLTIRVEATNAAVRNVVATGPVPIDWPEQHVELIGEAKPPGSTTRVTQFPGQAAMLVFRVPAIPAGGSASVERTYELTRSRILFQLDPNQLAAPKAVPRTLRDSLAHAPGVEIKDPKIIALADSLKKSNADAWTMTRDYYDWIRENVKFELGPFRGAASALENRTGDCEDLTALFVALCRTSGIPARTVWIEGHAYAEFYLEDAAGNGHWIPAQLSGPEWFGEMAEHRPILQKGNRFRDELTRRDFHYVPQSARALGGAVRLTCSREITPQQQDAD